MPLSETLITEFVKATTQEEKPKNDTTVYGTVVRVEEDVTYVKFDGSEQETPVAKTVEVNGTDDTKDYPGDRVMVTIKNHSAVITGNLSSHAVTSDSGTVKSIYDNIEADRAEIKRLESEMIKVEHLIAIDAKIQELVVVDAEVTGRLTVAEATISNLDTTYANIDFANITEAAVDNLYSKLGIINKITAEDGTFTRELVGVTIKGDLIEANTLVANKLVVLGEDGLYYKLNTDGMTVEAQQTEYNSLNGSIIIAKSITATKIDVSDLSAFKATIGGFKLSESSIYSGAKSSVSNTTNGIYLDDDGQFVVGGVNDYVKFYDSGSGTFKLSISASDIRLNTIDLTVLLGDAGKTATNYLNATNNGLVIGDLTLDTLGKNILIDSDSVDIRSGTAVRASFGEDYLYLAKHSRNAKIDLCNGLVEMYHKEDANGYSQFNIDTTYSLSYVKISAPMTDPLVIENTGVANGAIIKGMINGATVGGFGLVRDGYMVRYGSDADEDDAIAYRVHDEENFGTIDSSWKYGGVLGENFTLYSNDTQIQYRKIGKIVEIRGVVRPTINISGSSDNHTIFTLPVGYRPSATINERCQGSGSYSWLLSITSSGLVRFARYNDGSTYVDASTTSWLPFHATFFVD